MRPLRPTRHGGSRRHDRGQALTEFAIVAPILFVLLVGIFEAGRFVFYHQLVNHATREGARYAITHGARSACPSGPPPPGETNPCDPSGANVKAAVMDAALNLAGAGDLFIFDPVWTSRGRLSAPQAGDPSTGNNDRGEYITVFVDFTYEPIIRQVAGVGLVPSISVRAEETLVVNH